MEYGERPPLVLIVSRIHQVMGELASLRADGLYDRPPFLYFDSSFRVDVHRLFRPVEPSHLGWSRGTRVPVYHRQNRKPGEFVEAARPVVTGIRVRRPFLIPRHLPSLTQGALQGAALSCLARKLLLHWGTPETTVSGLGRGFTSHPGQFIQKE